MSAETQAERTRAVIENAVARTGVWCGRPDHVWPMVAAEGVVCPHCISHHEHVTDEVVRALAAAGLLPTEQAQTAHLTEQGRRLASERDDLIAQGVDPDDLLTPVAPVPVQAQTTNTLTDDEVEAAAREMWRHEHGRISSADADRTPESDERKASADGYYQWDHRVSEAVKDACRRRMALALTAARQAGDRDAHQALARVRALADEWEAATCITDGAPCSFHRYASGYADDVRRALEVADDQHDGSGT